MNENIEQQMVNALRILAVDAVENAQSGHPGMPMGMADIAVVLWKEFLKHNPKNPKWFDRDRFVVSNGHGSMLLYALLHLSGYDLSINDLKQFRQLKSRTPGHPEYGFTAGVETTTGPLGQGLANAVGMAIAEKVLAAKYNKPDLTLVDHYTYVFAGDGCLMEGISHEACSLAGTLGLNKLIVFYDDNGISIDGNVNQWFTDDTPKRFEAYDWHVIKNLDGHDRQAIREAIEKARAEKNRPTLICCKTIIGYGSPNRAGKNKAHSDPMGEQEIQSVRQQLSWNYPPFEIPQSVYTGFDATKTGEQFEKNWLKLLADYQKKYPEENKEFVTQIEKRLPKNWDALNTEFIELLKQKNEPLATRKSSQLFLNFFAPHLQYLLGGSADLSGSNCTEWKGSKAISKTDANGNYIFYGVREFAMFAMMNGIALHDGFIPYGGTFLTFADYGRNAIRLSAMMKQQVIFVFTHDSVGLGQDGPTHQPIEHINMLRMTPELSVWRPCDNIETAIAWRVALEQQKPTCLLLTRQNVDQIPRNSQMITNIQRGGYIIQQSSKTPDAIIFATGSEVALALKAANELAKNHLMIQVVSMPSTDRFDSQPENYRHEVLLPKVKKRIAIEAGATAFWYKYVGLNGLVVGIDQFGESAPDHDIFSYLGFTVTALIDKITNYLQESSDDN